MKKLYDFSKVKRGTVIPTTGKTRITIYVDDAVIKQFKAQSENQSPKSSCAKSYAKSSRQTVEH